MLTLAQPEPLSSYAARWGYKLDYVYGKTRSGLEHFRVCPVEAIAKYIAVVFLALLFLQVQRVHGKHRTLAEAWRRTARGICGICCSPWCHTFQHGAAEPVLKRFLRGAP